MPPVMDASEAIGTAQTARLLGVSEGCVRQLADSDRLPFMATPFGRLFDRRDVERLATARAAQRAERSG